MDFKFETVKANRISQNIVEQIRGAILEGELKIGDQLPPEKDFARHFGVSKSSLREAYRVLEAYGLLEIRQGMSGGAFVKEVDLRTVKDSLVNYFFFQNPGLREYTQIRMFIEPQVVKICAEKATEDDILYLEDNIHAMEQEPDGESFMSDLDSAFHKKLVDITGNKIISLIVESVQTALINIKRIVHTDEEFLHMVCQGHEKIVAAIRQRNPEMAGQAMIEHITDVETGMLASKNGSMIITEKGLLKRI
ncbi:FadR/GntR family transcriptional regulator [Desulfospira joergensenii]|uniref:FadR/GntR family transcriptional regulator n=1 Tax=Desulfospira joergensenii TaxID=53329 RepID=UPI0003B711A3|nr:FadR/GntR family transcriptional regulator [Desulfospira joergensenii]